MSDAASVSAGLGIVAVTVCRAVEAAGYFLDGEYRSASVGRPFGSALTSVVATVFVVKLLGDVGGHDRLLGPQWRIPGDRLADADRVRTAADRPFGTETLVVDREDRGSGWQTSPRRRSRPASTDTARTGPTIRAL